MVLDGLGWLKAVPSKFYGLFFFWVLFVTAWIAFFYVSDGLVLRWSLFGFRFGCKTLGFEALDMSFFAGIFQEEI